MATFVTDGSTVHITDHLVWVQMMGAQIMYDWSDAHNPPHRWPQAWITPCHRYYVSQVEDGHPSTILTRALHVGLFYVQPSLNRN